MTERDPHWRGVVGAEVSLSYADAEADTWGLRDRVRAGSETAVRTDDPVRVMASMAALDGWAAKVHLLPDGVEAPAGIDVVDVGPSRREAPPVDPAPPKGIETRWVVYTSGTTGTPKPVSHTLASLSRTVSRADGLDDLVWGLVYDPNRMAGLQVVLQAWTSHARLIAPDRHLPLRDRVAQMMAEGVTALSATPTLWRQILQVPGARDWPLVQITLGGEIADQPALSALRAAYPDTRIFHVFASTETGAAFTVRDGRAGFPLGYLDRAPKGIRLQVRDGRLFIHAPAVDVAGEDGFVDTGDEVEVTDDRVLFRGRATGVVNIGGANVWPEQVEALLRGHPDVAEAAVSAVPNALAGHLLMASVVLHPEADGAGAGKRLRSWVREHAPNTHVPARVTVVEELSVSSTGKLKR